MNVRGVAIRLTLAVVLLASAAGCGAGSHGSIAESYDLRNRQLSERGGQATVRLAVGSKDFAEQRILGHIAAFALRAAGAETVDRTGLGGTEQTRDALLTGDIDLYWEYTGTGWLIQLAQPSAAADPDELYRNLDALDRAQNGIAWLAPAPADNTYAVAVRDDVTDPAIAAVRTISDLAALAARNPAATTMCVGPEFSERADALPGLTRFYGFTVPPANLSVLPDATVYGAVDDGARCSFGSVFATNGLITELGLRLLDDDRGFFASYRPAVTLRQETLDRYPDLTGLFASISGRLDTETLRRLSADVLVRNAAPEDVAQTWLRDNGYVG